MTSHIPRIPLGTASFACIASKKKGKQIQDGGTFLFRICKNFHYLLLPTSTYMYLLLPTSTYIYLHLPTSTYFYLLLPTSTYFYLHLPTSTYIYRAYFSKLFLHVPTFPMCLIFYTVPTCAYFSHVTTFLNCAYLCLGRIR